MVNANMIGGGGHLRYKIIGISQYLGHEEGGVVHEHLQDLPLSVLKFSLIMVISGSSKNQSPVGV